MKLKFNVEALRNSLRKEVRKACEIPTKVGVSCIICNPCIGERFSRWPEMVYKRAYLELIVVPDEQMKHPFQELCILEKYYKCHRTERKSKYLIISPEEIFTNTLPASVFNGASGLACYRFSIKENATIIGSVSDIWVCH
jgi:hypothetical protein